MPLITEKELGSVSRIFRGKSGEALAAGMMRLLSIDKVNELYDRNSAELGPDFTSAVLKDIGLQYRLSCGTSGDLLGILPEGPFITISNHPCGHVDGLILVDIFGHLRPDYKVMVNRILSHIGTLDDSFIPVTPTGAERTAPTSASLNGVKAALKHLRSGGSLGLFPSGAVSDLSLKDRCVRDREWQDPVIRLIMKAEVPVVPVRFFGGNSTLYYSLGLIDWRIRLLRLPSEVFNKRGKTMDVGIGPVITVEQQKGYAGDIAGFRRFLRDKVYLMDCEW